MNIIHEILRYFSPCRNCKERKLEGLVACSCPKATFRLIKCDEDFDGDSLSVYIIKKEQI
jgi:hypothetical protein